MLQSGPVVSAPEPLASCWITPPRSLPLRVPQWSKESVGGTSAKSWARYVTFW